MRAALAWPVLYAQLLIFGTAAFTLTLGPELQNGRDRLIGSLINLWRGLGLVVLTLSPLLFVTIASGMAQMTGLKVLPLVPVILAATHAGRVWEWRLPIVTALALASWLPLRPTTMARVMLVASGALLFCESLTSHAIDRGMVAATVHFIHETAGAVWIGAILGIWLGALHAQLGKTWVVDVAPWVSRLAGWTVAALLLSGLYTTYHALMGDPGLLMYSSYGRVLLLKISAASIVLAIGAYNRFMVIPDLVRSEAYVALLRNVAIESILLIGVVGVAALLANTPPAHHFAG
jgi:putative copper resistance protein D